jgi:hypothetical protein
VPGLLATGLLWLRPFFHAGGVRIFSMTTGSSMQAITLTALPPYRHISIRANATMLATEGHKVFGMAGATTHPQETMFKTAAL